MIRMGARVEEVLSRRERKKLETRQALLEAAVSLFHEKGCEATTVEEITERADVAKGTFFNYFSSKEALLGELTVWGLDRLRAELDVGHGAPASPVARLKLLLGLMYEHAARNIGLARRAFAASLCHPPSPAPPPVRRHFLNLFNDLVDEAKSCGEIRADVDTGLVGDLLRLFFFRQMWVWGQDSSTPPPSEHFERFVDLLLEGLAGPNWHKA